MKDSEFTTGQRFVSIQALRFLAACAVILAHLQSHFQRALDAAHPLWRHLDFGAIGVDLFFVISGFVIIYASEPLFGQNTGFRKFILKRLLRIAPLYWLCTTFYLAFLIYLHHGITTDDLSYASIAGSYFFLPIPRPSGIVAPVLGVGWTLNIEMLLYAAVACVIAFPRFYAVAAATCIMAGLIYVVKQDPVAMFVSYNAPSHPFHPRVVQFICGMMLALLYRQGIRLSPVLSLGLGLLGMMILATAPKTFGDVAHFSNEYITALAFFCIVAGGALCNKTLKPTGLTRALCVCGDASYALYLTHTITFSILNIYVPQFSASLTHPMLLCTLPLVLSVGVAILVHLFIEKPVTQFLRARLPRLKIHSR